MNHNQKIGRWGEQLAPDYLQQKGYLILRHNARTPYREIDLVVQQGEKAVFVEVKARTSRAYGTPEMSVTPRKQQHLLAAAEYLAAEMQIDSSQVDVIAIEKLPNQKTEIVHFENSLA